MILSKKTSQYKESYSNYWETNRKDRSTSRKEKTTVIVDKNTGTFIDILFIMLMFFMAKAVMDQVAGENSKKIKPGQNHYSQKESDIKIGVYRNTIIYNGRKISETQLAKILQNSKGKTVGITTYKTLGKVMTIIQDKQKEPAIIVK